MPLEPEERAKVQRSMNIVPAGIFFFFETGAKVMLQSIN
jgi:hypothetical protein